MVGSVLTGCGDGGVDPQTYAEEVCGATSQFEEDVQNHLQTFGEELDPTGSPQELKDSFVGFLQDMREMYEETRTEVEEAGVPDVEGGEEFSQELSEVFESGSNQLQDAIEQAQDLPTGSPEEFAAAAQEIGTNLQTEGADISEEFENIETPEELEEAFEQEEGCPTG
jgi:flagellar hook-basal body complex protein FliE